MLGILPRFFDVVVYEHDPTERFYESWDLSASYISPFTVDDIVFAVAADARWRAEGTYDFWNYDIELDLYARFPERSVFIHEAKIKGADWQLAKEINAEFNLTKKSRRNPDWIMSRVDLFDIRDDEMEKRMQDNGGTLTLEVSYSIDGVFSVMSFTFVRLIKKGASWMT